MMTIFNHVMCAVRHGFFFRLLRTAWLL
jgi:hypothetical protein